MSKWKIKKEHLNDKGCYAYGGGVPAPVETNSEQPYQGPEWMRKSREAMGAAPGENVLNSVYQAARSGLNQAVAPLAAQVVPQEAMAAQAQPMVEAPQAPAMPQQAPVEPQQAPVAQGQHPVMEEAKIQGNIAEQQAAAYDQAIKMQQKAEADYVSHLSSLDAERNEITGWLEQNPVDARRYLNQQSTGGKVATAIGLLLGGIGGGLQGGKPNVALEFLHKNIDNDIRAQIENRKGKENLLAQLERKYGNETTAQAMLRSTLQTDLANKINKAALDSGDALAQARAKQVVAQLQASAAAPLQEVAKERAFNDALASGQDFSAIAPYMSDKQQRRAVPGFGLASDPEIAKKLKEEHLPAFESAKNIIQQLKQISTTDKLNPVARSKATSLHNQLMGSSKTAIVGPGAVSETEWEILRTAIPNPTDIFALAAQDKLSAFESNLEKGMQTRLKSAGLNVPQQAKPTQSSSIKSFRPSK